MKGQRGRDMLRRHSTGSARFNEIREAFSRVQQGRRPGGAANPDDALRDAVAGDRRGTSPHKATARKGGGR